MKITTIRDICQTFRPKSTTWMLSNFYFFLQRYFQNKFRFGNFRYNSTCKLNKFVCLSKRTNWQKKSHLYTTLCEKKNQKQLKVAECIFHLIQLSLVKLINHYYFHIYFGYSMNIFWNLGKKLWLILQRISDGSLSPNSLKQLLKMCSSKYICAFFFVNLTFYGTRNP